MVGANNLEIEGQQAYTAFYLTGYPLLFQIEVSIGAGGSFGFGSGFLFTFAFLLAPFSTGRAT